MLNQRLLMLILSAIVLLTGCHQYAVADDIDLEFNFAPLGGPSDELHLPYVQGTKVTISVLDLGNDQKDRRRFTIASTDSSVLRVDQQDSDGGAAQCSAVGVGTTTIRVLKDDVEVYTTDITVKAPTRATLQPNGPLLAGVPIELPATGSTKILAGGTATYLVEYFAGNEKLFGNGVLTATSSDDTVVNPEQTFLFENREWLQVSPASTGTHSVALAADGISLGSLTVDAVDESAVAKVVVEPEDTSDARNGDWYVVLAQAFDAKAEPIFGVDYKWDRSGTAQDGEGDLFRYEFDSKNDDTVTATFGGMSDSTQVHAGEGFVDSSNNVGCSVSSGEKPVSQAAGAMAALALLGAVRRRRATRRNPA